jgi:hypothetical protein
MFNDIQQNSEGLYYRLCDVCGKEITNRFKSQIKQRTCSHSCQFKGNSYRKGIRPANAFKIGDTLGDKNINWKGDSVGYYATHDWIARHYGRPQKCENCGTTNAKRFEWANISGEYKRDIKDWKRLCRRCHFEFDGGREVIFKISSH